MSAQWSWLYLAESGEPMAADETADLPSSAFPTQAEAENWLRECWPDLLDAGVDAVTLVHGEEVVYGPMSIQS